MSETASGFVRALAALRERGVEFVLVGVGGINFYARTPGGAFATRDLDAFLAPEIENLRRALGVLSRLGYSLEAGNEPFVDIDDAAVLGRILERAASLRAIHPEAGEIDLLTAIAGFGYAELSEDATTFAVAGTEVRVGRLEKLLQSTQASGRPNDLAFLEAFRARALDDES